VLLSFHPVEEFNQGCSLFMTVPFQDMTLNSSYISPFGDCGDIIFFLNFDADDS
jgi:hypothetical protein